MDPGESTPRGRRSRLTRSGDFDAVYRRGRSASSRHLVVYAFRRDDAVPDEIARLGVSVSKKVGGAVERNRVKRVLREQFTAFAGDLPRGTDVVAIARPGIVEHIDERGSGPIGERLRELALAACGEKAARA